MLVGAGIASVGRRQTGTPAVLTFDMVASSPSRDPLVNEAVAAYARVRAKLEPSHDGEFVVLNLDTGEYEVDASDLAASDRARQRFGAAARLVTMRVGRLAAYNMGARRARGEDRLAC